MVIALILGAVFGFVSAVPVAGPISAIILSRGMRGKFAEGRWTAWGAGLIEGAYAFLAFWGFSHFLAHLDSVVKISDSVAAVILAVLGVYFFRSKKMRKPANESETKDPNEEKAFLLGAGMSAINPSLIASWTIVATTVSSMSLFDFSILNSGLFSAGVCIGIIVWFTLLLKLMEKNRDRFNQNFLDKGLKAIGILLGGLSLWMIYKVVSSL